MEKKENEKFFFLSQMKIQILYKNSLVSDKIYRFK